MPSLADRIASLDDAMNGMDAHRVWVFADLILHNYYWRQTKDSVKDDYKLPGLLEQLVLVQFSEVERQLYLEAESDGPCHHSTALIDVLVERRLQICCHPQAQMNEALDVDRLDDLPTIVKKRVDSIVQEERNTREHVKNQKKLLKEEKAKLDRGNVKDPNALLEKIIGIQTKIDGTLLSRMTDHSHLTYS